MQRTRYSAIDVYTLEELWREYQASEPRGRIRLLKKLYRDDRRPPYEIAQMAVEDPHVEVRQWMATHLERLALLRNTKIRNADELIQKIFDKDDQELGVDPEARQQLAWAYLTNAKAMGDAPRKSYDFVS